MSGEQSWKFEVAAPVTAAFICPACFALTIAPAAHQQWHQRLGDALTAIAENDLEGLAEKYPEATK